MKILVISDSYKGTLSSEEVGKIISGVIRKLHPDFEVSYVPVADGGEGTVDAVLSARKGERIRAVVHGPYYEEMEAEYAYFPEDDSAVIEMAACSGLTLVGDRKNPSLTTTLGVGELVRHAADKGARKIYVGLGGSCTNDGGCGFASAIGTRFYDEAGRIFVPTGGTLKDISRIKPAHFNKEIIALCDVDNPLCGPKGASYVYGPQKGADEQMVRELDAGLEHLAETVRNDLGMDYRDVPGTGAAGGLGFGLISFASARIEKGIHNILDLMKYEKISKDADIIITGEGRLDYQSLHGKVVDGVIKRSAGKRVILVVGSVQEDLQTEHEVYSTLSNGRTFPRDRKQAALNLAETVREMCERMF